jgi:dihydropyrimidinase
LENTCELLVTNGRVVIPYKGVFETNLLIEEGKIKSIRKSTNNVQADHKVDAKGNYVLPGLIDPHVHYGVFTPIEKASRTESRAAAIGGVTTMMRMIRINGSYKQISKHIDASKNNHLVDYAIHASILNQSQIKEMDFLSTLGVNSFKIYMNLGSSLNQILADIDPGTSDLVDTEVNMNERLIRNIAKKSAQLNSTLLVHAEDYLDCAEKLKTFKARKMKPRNLLKAWSNLRPPSTEVKSIIKMINFGSLYNSNLYFVHIGSSEALYTIIQRKRTYEGKIWVETCPHYLTHSIDYNDAKGKVVPPLRTKNDVRSIWDALEKGHVDTIGTDHVANNILLKNIDADLWDVRAGFPGIGTMLPVMLSEGVNRGRIDIIRLSELCSYNTARIFGLFPKKGNIAINSDADLTIIDIDKELRVTPDLLQSFSDYSIYDGWKLRGWPIMTIVRGRIVMENGEIDEKMIGQGKFVNTKTHV